MGIRNSWSLNVDESLVADKLQSEFEKKDYQVFFPLNAQLKDIDLILLNLRKMRPITIQVKGSITYKPKKAETKRYGEGSSTWIVMNKKSVYGKSTNVDYFIFVCYSLVDGLKRKEIRTDYLILPSAAFRKLIAKKNVRKNGKYHFFIWIDSKGHRAFDINEGKDRLINFSKFLNNWAIIKLGMG